MTPPPSIDRDARLKRMKAIALAFLLGAMALLVLAQWQGRAGIWAWVGAFSEAATIGALADWFAVVALFRHPLGIPIPHTAIVPRKKASIADALGRFLVDNFLTREQLLARVDGWNPARRIGDYLAAPERVQALADQFRGWARHALGALGTPAFEREVHALVHRQLKGWDASATAARLTRLLTAGQHHQRLLNAGLLQIAHWMDREDVREHLTERIVTMARREFPKVMWVSDTLHATEDLGAALSRRLAEAIINEVRTVLDTPEHPLRQRYASEATKLLARLESDPDFQAKVESLKQRALASPLVQDYARDVARRLWQWLEEDLAREDSVLAAHLRDYAQRLGRHLREDPVWQDTLNAQLRIAAEHLAGQLREIAPGYIRQTVEAWDTRRMVNEIEASVGRDLQFIRLNGTLIGGLAGLLLHALFRFAGLH